jgi:hypothetical protein
MDEREGEEGEIGRRREEEEKGVKRRCPNVNPAYLPPLSHRCAFPLSLSYSLSCYIVTRRVPFGRCVTQPRTAEKGGPRAQPKDGPDFSVEMKGPFLRRERK